MSSKRAKAIHSLRPNSEWALRGDVLTWVDSKQTEPTNSEIDAELTRLQAIDNYQKPRREQYPSIQEQLDLQYWDKKNGTNKWVEAIAKVKSDNPKP